MIIWPPQIILLHMFRNCYCRLCYHVQRRQLLFNWKHKILLKIVVLWMFIGNNLQRGRFWFQVTGVRISRDIIIFINLFNNRNVVRKNIKKKYLLYEDKRKIHSNLSNMPRGDSYFSTQNKNYYWRLRFYECGGSG